MRQMTEYIFKYIIVGDSGVGKSSINLQFTNNKFNDNHGITIGIDIGIKSVNVNNKQVRIQIWDTAGQEIFKSIIHAYYKGVRCVLLVYSVTNASSFKSLDKWLTEVKQLVDDPYIILIGNKADIDTDRQVSIAEGKQFATKNNMEFFETSAKNQINIDNVFIESATNILNLIDKKINSKSSNIKENLYNNQYVNLLKPKRKRCCDS
jgi:small GTP-binding protein